MELFAEIHLHMTFQKHSQGSNEGRRMELPGHTLSTSDPVQQDSLKDWRLKTSPLKKTHKDPTGCPLGSLFSMHIWKACGVSSYGSKLKRTKAIG